MMRGALERAFAPRLARGCEVHVLGAGAPAWAPLPACVAIGAFDGVHRGHRHLLGRCVADARARGVAAVAVTFDPDPDVVVSAAPASKLLCRADRLRALSASGVDAVVVVPFTSELAALDHEAFFTRVLAPELDIRAVHVGSDFRLGAHGASTVEVIRAWGRGRGIEILGHDLVLDDAAAGAPEVISATHIRAALAAGDVHGAARMLGRDPYVAGTVVHGRGEGTGLGFPTANVERAEPLQMPADGVYAGWVLTGAPAEPATITAARPVAYPAAINVGLPPMFADHPESATLEATLVGFSGDLYGAEVAVLFIDRLRPPARFDSLDALVSAVRGNIEDVRRTLGAEGVAL